MPIIGAIIPLIGLIVTAVMCYKLGHKNGFEQGVIFAVENKIKRVIKEGDPDYERVAAGGDPDCV